jgi:hypothetical protein
VTGTPSDWVKTCSSMATPWGPVLSVVHPGCSGVSVVVVVGATVEVVDVGPEADADEQLQSTSAAPATTTNVRRPGRRRLTDRSMGTP